jgi:Na+-transporting NADH:ubiquinone oxidoreductase subunit A
MSEYKIKRGYDVPMIGAAERVVEDAGRPHVVSIRPDEFRAVKPKILVQDGDKVQAGQPLFHDRQRPEVVFPSPGGGEVVEVRYGRRRKCLEVFVKLDGDESWTEHRKWSPEDARKLSRAQVVEALLDGGMWSCLRQRPYSVIPDPESVPEAIFIAASDSGPLPFDPSLALDGREADFQLGVDLLAKLTEGKVHLCLAKKGAPSRAFAEVSGCEKHAFSGPYPSGLIEAQIHYVMPHRKGRRVWYLDCQDVAAVGEMFRTGRYPVDRVVAVGGEGADARKHFRTRRGVSAGFLLKGNSHPARNRFVSGGVLTGVSIRNDSGLGFYDSKFCVFPEGAEPEFIGWMKPGFGRVSRFRAFASALAPPRAPHLTANLNGGVRAHVATGIYEDVCAVDILPAYLMKAALAGDFEEMDALGLHDCAECGLCTFVCPSKIEFGGIIARGIGDFLKEEEG